MVTWGNGQFFIDGQPFEIHSGAIHYFRSLPQKWPELLQKLKQCGLNTVETYCAWNLHEPQPGVFDFAGRLDIERFITLAAAQGLYVILRPGPYICAEWDAGGLPAWLLADERCRMRTDEGSYLAHVKRYFEALLPRIVPHLQTNGGNVILVAVENEYGSFGNSTAYMNKCAALLQAGGVDVPLFTADGHTDLFLAGGHADGCLCGLDFGYDGVQPQHFAALRTRQPDAPLFHAEWWIGMFSHWGQPRQSYSAQKVAAELQAHLAQHASFNLYMFHGGTNFGFTNGANAFAQDPDDRMKLTYYADITSYDYDALLTEWGEVTPKYLAVQRVMAAHLGRTLSPPAPVPVQALGDIPLTEGTALFDNLSRIGRRYMAAMPRTMEHYGQSFGYILYRTTVAPAKDIALLAVTGLADRANIYFNGVWRGALCRNDDRCYLEVDGWMDEGGQLDILVENQGRVNFGPLVDAGERKGIAGRVTVTQTGGPTQNLCNWEIYTLPMEALEALRYPSQNAALAGPVFYRGSFQAEKQLDCFVHPDNFTKGFVTVNGFNLGRFWDIGPQRSLYLPGCLLQKQNEIVVFCEAPVERPVVSIRDHHVLDAIRTDEGPVTIR